MRRGRGIAERGRAASRKGFAAPQCTIAFDGLVPAPGTPLPATSNPRHLGDVVVRGSKSTNFPQR